MNVVLDTNVLVSGLLTPSGSCGIILDMIFTRQIRPVFDARLLDEYHRVLHSPKFDFKSEHLHDFLGALRMLGMKVSPRRVHVTLPDVSDLPFLECALTLPEGILVTGNQKHFPASLCAPARILNPREFINLVFSV